MISILLKEEAEDRLLLALDPEKYYDISENIKTAFIVTISFCDPALIPEPSQILRYKEEGCVIKY